MRSSLPGQFPKNQNMKRRALQEKWKTSASKRVTPVPAKTQRTFAPRVQADLPELKFKDTTKAATVVAAAGTIYSSSLLLMQEGNTDQTRIGNKIRVKSVMLRGTCNLPAATAATDTSQNFRIIVYQDRQANGAAAAVTDILASADFRSFNNLDNTDRFRTLAETTIDLVAPGATPSGAAYVFGEATKMFFLKGKLNLDVKYKGNVGDITDLASNNIGVLVIAGTDALGTVGYIARVKFTDL